jgi:RimJ/RimL family protein N-acetyltransferase
MLPETILAPVTREDVQRLAQWLEDDDVNGSWYGRGEDGQPLHIGYSPREMLQAPADQWRQVFEDEDRRIFAIRGRDGQHIGEGQLLIEPPLLEAQLFIIIGRKELWHQHYGTTALLKLLDHAFRDHRLHRVWADVPDYNQPALQMFRHVGFVLEGHLRGTHRKDGQWYDSSAMGLLAEEYTRRRARLVGSPAS